MFSPIFLEILFLFFVEDYSRQKIFRILNSINPHPHKPLNWSLRLLCLFDYGCLGRGVVAWMISARLMWSGSLRLLKFDCSQRMRSGMEHGECNPAPPGGESWNSIEWSRPVTPELGVPAGTLQPPSGPIQQCSVFMFRKFQETQLNATNRFQEDGHCNA